jgi:hypothetical protein
MEDSAKHDKRAHLSWTIGHIMSFLHHLSSTERKNWPWNSSVTMQAAYEQLAEQVNRIPNSLFATEPARWKTSKEKTDELYSFGRNAFQEMQKTGNIDNFEDPSILDLFDLKQTLKISKFSLLPFSDQQINEFKVQMVVYIFAEDNRKTSKMLKID